MQSMMNVLAARIAAALGEIVAQEQLPAQLVVPTQNADFGDYQCNCAMGLARVLRKAPRAIADDIVARLRVDDCCEPPEVAGPGFINLRLKPAFVATMLGEMAADARMGLPEASKPQRVIIDFSGPNLAKEMHVGHLRSTIIGDSIARFLEFDGHHVVRANHVGDWGTQFGMLIHYIRETQSDAIDRPEAFAVDDLEHFYQQAKKRFDECETFAEAARRAVVDLQQGDEATLAVWKVFCDESLRHCHAIYSALDIQITDRGESTYNAMLPAVVNDLRQAGLAQESQGAVCVFLDGYRTRDDEPLPMIVQKSDGGYNYETTDLAAIRYRFDTVRAHHAVYITDARQAQHFAMVFETAETMKWAPVGALEHIGFGTMLGADGKPFRTRDGGTVKLKALLAEAEARAYPVARELNADLDEDDLRAIARTVGRSTVKYADLVHAIGTDYKFDWDKMLALDGNTAVYQLYNFARTRSISRKAGVDVEQLLGETPFVLTHPREIELAKTLLRTLDIWPQVVKERAPHVLLAHLYDVAQAFSRFWNACPGVIHESDTAVRHSRLALCGLVGRTLKWGLSMVGISTLERM